MIFRETADKTATFEDDRLESHRFFIFIKQVLLLPEQYNELLVPSWREMADTKGINIGESILQLISVFYWNSR